MQMSRSELFVHGKIGWYQISSISMLLALDLGSPLTWTCRRAPLLPQPAERHAVLPVALLSPRLRCSDDFIISKLARRRAPSCSPPWIRVSPHMMYFLYPTLQAHDERRVAWACLLPRRAGVGAHAPALRSGAQQEAPRREDLDGTCWGSKGAARRGGRGKQPTSGRSLRDAVALRRSSGGGVLATTGGGR